MDDVVAFRDKVYARFGEVGILMNNAGRGKGGGPFENYEGWQQVLATNLWGVINGVHLVKAEVTDPTAEATHVDVSDHLAEDVSLVSLHLNLRAVAGRARTL